MSNVDMFQRFATGLMTGQAQADRNRTRTAQDEAARMLKEGNSTGASQALMAAGLYGDASTMTNVSGVNRRTDARMTAGRNYMTDPRAAAGTLFEAGEFDEARTIYGDAINREAGVALSQDDPKGASAIAAAGGKVELATQLIDWADRLDERGREEALGRQKTMAPILYNIARLPYEQRRSAIASQTQALGGAGFTPEQIAGFDPTDENIRALVDSTVGIEKLLGTYSQREVGDDLRTYRTNAYGVSEVGRETIPVTRDEARQDERLDLERERLERTPVVNSTGDVLGPLLQRYTAGEPLNAQEQAVVDRYLTSGSQTDLYGGLTGGPLPGVGPSTGLPQGRQPPVMADPFPGISEGETVTQKGVTYRRQGNQMVRAN